LGDGGGDERYERLKDLLRLADNKPMRASRLEMRAMTNRGTGRPPAPRLRLFVFALATVSALLAGAPSAGAATVRDARDGFSFSLPTRWVQIPLSGADVGVLVNEATRVDPSLSNVLGAQVQQAMKQGLKVFAVGPVAGGFLPNLNVGVKPATGMMAAASYPALELQLKIFLRMSGLKAPRVAEVHLPFGTAVQATYLLRLSGPSRSAYGRQLYFIHAHRLYVVTSTAAKASQAAAIEHFVAVHWRWGA
jgi:hypothetical protein